jgi:hypothetical protein
MRSATAMRCRTASSCSAIKDGMDEIGMLYTLPSAVSGLRNTENKRLHVEGASNYLTA